MNLNVASEMKLEDASVWEDVLKLRDNSPEKKRLEEIRQISNVIQALKNLVVQCEGVAGFEELQELAKGALDAAEVQLRRQVHLMQS